MMFKFQHSWFAAWLLLLVAPALPLVRLVDASNQFASSSLPSSPRPAALPEDSSQPQESSVSIPVIDLSSTGSKDEDQLAQEIADACSTFGFFQVTSHGISEDLMTRFRVQCHKFFALPMSSKTKIKRNSHNARGFFDDELTQQRRDWKECLDIGVPASRRWTVGDDSPFNCCLDGFNQLPSPEDLPDFRNTMVEYFQACEALSHRLTCLMARGLGLPDDDPFVMDLKQHHSSYLRMNYYPPSPPEDAKEMTPAPGSPPDTASLSDTPPLGISPHNDAGFLTVLLQDDDCHSLQACIHGTFVSVSPVPGALTINTGDMAQIWSNGKYKAPLHRVLTDSTRQRYSAPFFYNPGYDWLVTPILRMDHNDNERNENENNHPALSPKYLGVLWGYFRAVRFAGDLTNLGVEIQIEHFQVDRRPPSAHLQRQTYFQEGRWTSLPFDVDRYRVLMEEFPDTE